MRLFNIAIYRKIPTIYGDRGPKTLYIELGKWWEIVVTRRYAEDIVLPRTKEIPPAVKYGPLIFKQREFIKYLKGGDYIPFWYGYAYYDFNRDCAAYCPVPINFLVAGVRWLGRKWWELKQAPQKFNSTHEAYGQGRKDGYAEGYDEGTRKVLR